MNVYRVGSLYGTHYFNTVREANKCRPGGEEPESVDKINAAEECARLDGEIEAADKTISGLRLLLHDLVDSYPNGLPMSSEAWRRVVRFVNENPLPPADSADRDGQHSYGG